MPDCILALDCGTTATKAAIYNKQGNMLSLSTQEYKLLTPTYWNIQTRQWWQEMLDFLGISTNQMPEIKHPGEFLGTLNETVAKE